MPILGILGLMFVGAKLTGLIFWSWWLVLLPFYIVIAIILIILGGGAFTLLGVLGVSALMDRRRQATRRKRWQGLR